MLRPHSRTPRRGQTVDFTKLDMATLKRYKRHYRLKTRQERPPPAASARLGPSSLP